MNLARIGLEAYLKEYKYDPTAYLMYADILKDDGEEDKALIYQYIGKHKKWPQEKLDVVNWRAPIKRFIFEKSRTPISNYQLPPYIFNELSEHFLKIRVEYSDLRLCINDLIRAVDKARIKGWIKA